MSPGWVLWKTHYTLAQKSVSGPEAWLCPLPRPYVSFCLLQSKNHRIVPKDEIEVTLCKNHYEIAYFDISVL